jgi:NADPH-dependent 7-cyano-7-deazaguanine reductase QueF
MAERPRFLDSDVTEPESSVPEFTALGHAGSEHYVGLETFPNPGCANIQFSGDELVAHCPVTGQPDFYEWGIMLREPEKSIESKSLKLWLRQFAREDGPGLFCETLAVYIREQVAKAIGEDVECVTVTLVQKSRGGISIRASA